MNILNNNHYYFKHLNIFFYYLIFHLIKYIFLIYLDYKKLMYNINQLIIRFSNLIFKILFIHHPTFIIHKFISSLKYLHLLNFLQ